MHLLDTNACISFMRGNASMRNHFQRQQDSHSIYLCTIVQAELWHGFYAAAQST